MFDRSYPRAVADRLIPALLWGQPRLHTAGVRAFPLTQHALAGWRRLEPPRSLDHRSPGVCLESCLSTTPYCIRHGGASHDRS